MMTLVRHWLKSSMTRLLSPLGYEVRRTPKGHRWGIDAYDDQVALLGDRDVRMIFDVGANLGQTATRYRQLFPKATVHSFEPFPQSFSELKATAVALSNIVPHQLAATNRRGAATLFSNKSHYTNSLLPTDPQLADYVDRDLATTIGEVSVRTERLDDFCLERGIVHLDILKIDVQGGEGEALEGASRLLSGRCIDLVFTEVLFAPMYVGQASVWDVQRLLASHGYWLFGLYEMVHTGPHGLAWADAIFLPPAAKCPIG